MVRRTITTPYRHAPTILLSSDSDNSRLELMSVFNHTLFFTAFIIVYSINDRSLFREKNKPGPTPTGSIYPFVQQSSPIDATRSIQTGRFGATERDIL